MDTYENSYQGIRTKIFICVQILQWTAVNRYLENQAPETHIRAMQIGNLDRCL